MCAVAELGPCSFLELCEECHPELEEYRSRCTDENCDHCGIYWAFQDGYNSLMED